MKKNLKWIVCILFLILFVLLAITVQKGDDIYLDSFAYKIVSKFINDDLTVIIKFLTYIGSAIAVIGITLFTLIFFKNKQYGLFMSIDLIVITIIQVVLKNIFSRGRPVDINLIKETGYSFPSGHSITSMAFYGFIIYLIYTSELSKKSKILYISMFSLLILVTGFSRVYLGVHYFTDVLGGFTLAISFLIVYTSIIGSKLRK